MRRPGLPRPAGADTWALLALAGGACLLLPQVVLLGKLPDHYDFWLQEYVHLAYLHRWLHAGEIPLWNGQLALGTPHLADPQTAVLYPLTTLPLLLLSPAVVERLSIPFHYWLAGAGTYAYARRLGQSHLGATAAGLAYSLAPHFAPIELPTYLQQSAAWVPAICWALETAYQRRSLPWFALAGALWALQALRGTAQTWYVTGLLLAVFCLLRTLAPAAGRRQPDLTALVGPVLAIGLGLALAAAQLLPSLDLLDQSQRSGGYSLVEASGPGRLSLLNLLGAPGPDAEVSGAFPGSVTLTLALGALLFGRGGALWRHAALAAVALALALGNQTPVWALAYRLLPGFATLHMPHRMLFLWSLALAVLAGFGLDALRRRPSLRPLALAAAVLLGALWLAVFQSGAPPEALAGVRQLTSGAVATLLVALALVQEPFPALAGGALSAGTVLVALMALDLLGHSLPRLYGRFYPPAAVYAAPPAARWLAERLPPGAEPVRFASHTFDPAVDSGEGSRLQDNRRLAYLPPNVPALYPGLEGAQGYLAIHLARSEQQLEAVNDLGRKPRVLSVYDPRSRLLDLFGVRYFVADGAERFPSVVAGGRSLVARDGIAVAPVRDPLPAAAVELLSSLGDSVDVPDGEVVARLTLVATDGREVALPIRAGEHTAEWLYDAPAIAGQVRHRLAPVASSNLRADGSQSRVYRAVFELAGEGFPRVREVRLAATDARARWNVDRVILYTNLADHFRLAAEPARPAGTPPLRIWENPSALPRAWLVGGYVTAADEAAQLEMLSQPGFDFRAQAVLASAFPGLAPGATGASATGSAGTVSWRGETANTRAMDVSAGGPALLVIAETYAAGWRATVDGQAVPLLPADGGLMAIPVQAGAHRVALRYLPGAVVAGAVISAAGWILVGAWLGWWIIAISRRQAEHS